jgi:hypothetical protein
MEKAKREKVICSKERDKVRGRLGFGMKKREIDVYFCPYGREKRN